MISKFLRVLNIILILAVLQACSQIPASPITGQTTNIPATAVPGSIEAGQATNIPATAAPVAFVAETTGPAGFSAALAAPDIVLLTWETAPGAVGYELQIVFDGLDPLPIAYLPKDATSFKHYLAPESSLLTYRLQTITASGPAGASSLQVTTQGHAPNPLTAQAISSTTGIISDVIGPAGGTIETTDEHGVSYTLVIPPQALDADLKITMTPVSKVGGWPLDGKFLGAVKLEPEGWLLNEVAYLTIRLPAAPKPSLATVGFAFNGSGEEFHLAPANAGSSPITGVGTSGGHLASPFRQQDAGVFNLPVTELRTAGLGAASADSAAALAVKNAPTSSSDAVDQKAAVTAVADADLAPLWSASQTGMVMTTDLFTQIYLIHNCNDFHRAAASFGAWETSTAELGSSFTARSIAKDMLMEELAKKAVEAIEKSSTDCVKAPKGAVPASVPCAERLTHKIETANTSAGADPFYTDLLNTMMKTPGLTGRMAAAKRAAEACPLSYSVNTAKSLGFSWTSACIPSLDRPYQVAFKGANSTGEWRLYPSDSFSGRVEGQTISEVGGGVTQTEVFEGTYKMNKIINDAKGNPLSMDADLTFQDTATMCVGGACTSTTFDGTDMIPMVVNKTRCALP